MCFPHTHIAHFSPTHTQYNLGSPLAAELIAYLHNLGYVMLDIVEEERVHGPGMRRGILNQVDFAFAQKNSSLLKLANDIGIRNHVHVPHTPPAALNKNKGKKEGWLW